MSLASTWFDLCIGIDLHFEMVPTPAPVPMPFPHPFVGTVYDPIGLLVSLGISASFGSPGGPVLINGVPATNTGTEAIAIPHFIIPPGTAWTPMPKAPAPTAGKGPPEPGNPVAPDNDAVVITGSKTVSSMGSNQCRLGDLAMSCAEPVRLPSSMIVAIPKGAPVIVGGPPSLDLMAAAMAMIRTKWVAGKLHTLVARIKNARLRNFFQKAVCMLTGHPVDVATGRVLTDAIDWDLPGRLPLKFERNYSSGFASRRTALGHGWAHSLDQAIWEEPGKVVYRDADGREIEFDCLDLPGRKLEPGRIVENPFERLSLRHLGLEGWELRTHDGLIRHFSPVAGRRDGCSMLRQVLGRSGQRIVLEYDPRGRLARVTDSCDRQIEFEHDERDLLTGVWLPEARGPGRTLVRSYHYDAVEDLVEVRDALGASWTFEYANHLLVRETDRAGMSYYFGYDGTTEEAYCVRTWGDGGRFDRVLDYDKAGHRTFVTNSLGHTTTYVRNEFGAVVEIIEPAQSTHRFEYDEWLRRTREIDPLGGERSWEYDKRGNNTAIVDPDGARREFCYDEHNSLVAARNPLGEEWGWRYDGLGRLIERRGPTGDWVRLAYHDGDLRELIDESGARTVFEWDTEGNLRTLHFPDGGTAHWNYDRHGRVVEMRDRAGARTKVAHDLLGRVLALDTPDGRDASYRYDPEGRIVHASDQLRSVELTWSASGELLVRREAGTAVEFEYDTESRLSSITNADGQRLSFERDANGDIIAETRWGERYRRRYRRDALRRIVAIERADGSSTQLHYDAAGNRSARRDSDGYTCKYEYDQVGRMLAATDGNGRLEFEYDASGRILSESQAEHRLTHRYDLSGRRVQTSSSLGVELVFERDRLGRVQRLAVDGQSGYPAPWAVEFERDCHGLELERRLPGSARLRWERDQCGRPVSRHVEAQTGIEAQLGFGWDVGARLSSLSTGQRVTRLGHDALANLAWLQHADGRIEHRVLDPVGNLFQRRDCADRSYGPSGELLAMMDDAGRMTRFEYDDNGSRIAKHRDDATWRYHWNVRGQLESVETPTGELVRFLYDALGRRIAKQTAAGTTRWIWDGARPLHEWTDEAVEPAAGPPASLTTWVFEPDSFTPLAKLGGGRRLAFIGDHLGTPTTAIDDSGAVVWRGECNLAGQLRTTYGDEDTCPFGFPGHYRDDDVGLHYNFFRYYDPESSTYVSQDPIGLAGGHALYSYVGDPTRAYDPLGLASCGDDEVFYSVQSRADADRLLAGGSPWPTGLQRGNMGPGLYTWDNLSDANRYRELLQRHGAGDLVIMEFQIPKSELDSLQQLDLRRMTDDQVNAWMDEFSHYGAGNPHGYDYVVRQTAMGAEHYFATDVFPRFTSAIL